MDAAWENRHKPQRLNEYDPKIYNKISLLNKFKTTKCKPLTRTQFIQQQPTNKRQKYISCLGKTQEPTNIIKSFVKIEKTSSTKYKAPRLIQARNPYYTMELGRYTLPLEHKIYQSDKNNKKNNFYKGVNLYEGAQFIIHKWKKFKNPLALCLDHSSFDAHVTTEALKLFHKFIKNHYKDTKQLSKLLGGQIHNRAYTQFGQKFNWTATVASGDITTSFCDSIINQYILTHWLREHKVKGEIIVNGDDSIVVIDKKDRYKLGSPKNIIKNFRRYNMETKIDMETEELDKIEFCRMTIGRDNDGIPMMYMNKDRQEDVYGMRYKLHNIDHNTYQRDIAYTNMNIYRHTNRRDTFRKLFEHYDKLTDTPFMTTFRTIEPLLYNMLLTSKRESTETYPDLVIKTIEDVNIGTHKTQNYPIFKIDHITKTIRQDDT